LSVDVIHRALSYRHAPAQRKRSLDIGGAVYTSESRPGAFPPPLAYAQTPYELLRRSHRSAQRQVEKEFTVVQVRAFRPLRSSISACSAQTRTHAQNALQAMLKNLPPQATALTDDGKAALVGKLDQVAERTKGLKRKVGRAGRRRG
jgi:hypothetical protein